MPVTVAIPTVLRKTTGNEKTIAAEGEDILAVIEHIDARYPGFRERMIDELGRVRRFVNVYINSEDIRYLDGPKSQVKAGDEIAIIPAIAGGCI